jgi:hypothetical protein
MREINIKFHHFRNLEYMVGNLQFTRARSSEMVKLNFTKLENFTISELT